MQKEFLPTSCVSVLTSAFWKSLYIRTWFDVATQHCVILKTNYILEEICTLVIAEAFPEDSGMFTCTASNTFGTVSSTAALRVQGNVF